uniref:USP domain-containing protein n=1 Tax=Triticum aestivum TaxID=4565 RepID=A0A3B6QJK7_WHEAT
MGEAAAAAAAHRRIQFHASAGPGAAGGAPMQRPYPNPDRRLAVAAAAREKKGEAGAGAGGLDRELAAARVYLRRIGAGLRNLGNTCYLNSVLQCLTYTEPFVAYLQSGKHTSSSCRAAGFCALCALQNHVRCALQSTGKILTPVQFVKNLKCISRSFRYYRQEDAHELMVNLLESMHKCCLPSGIPSQSQSAYENSLVHRIFGGRLRSQVRCASCSHCSSKFDPFLDLSLEIANAATLVKALQNFTEEQALDGGEKQYNCQSCKKKVVAKKRFTIDKAPDVLTIHLKRFSPFNPGQKINKKVDFQSTLNLKPFVSNSEGMDFRYSLYGVLVHAGWNTQSGHYYCFVRTSSGIWHNLDDNEVCQVREADVLRQKAYMLFYVRDRVRSSVMLKNNGAAGSLVKNAISEKTANMNGTIRNGLMEAKLNVPSFTNGDVKSQKQNPDDGRPSIFGSSSHGQCSKYSSSTGVIEAAAVQNNGVQNNGMVSVQTAAATLSINTTKTTSDSEREIVSSAQPDVIVPHNSSCDPKAYEKPLQEQQPESDGAFTDSGKGSIAALPICNGGDGMLEENHQASEPRTDPCGEQTLNTSKPAESAEIKKTKHMMLSVSNGTMSSREDLTCCNEAKESAESGKQPDEIAMEELSAESTGAITNAVEQQMQASMQNNDLVAGQAHSETHVYSEVSAQAICPEVSAQAICPEVCARSVCPEVCGQSVCPEVSAQAMCPEVSAQAICPEDPAQAICPEVSAQAICPEVPAQVICPEASAQAICPEDPAQVLDKDPCHGNFRTMKDLKSKKHTDYSTVHLLFVSKQPLLAALKLHKKRKHKRAKRQSIDNGITADDQQTSTSETVFTKDISCKSHRRRKRSRASASSDNGIEISTKKPHLIERSSSAADLPVDKKDDKDATLASAELPGACVSSVPDQTDSRNSADANERVPSHFDLLTRGLSEITVPLWDDIDMSRRKSEFQYPRRTESIGYVLDEWDEEYDRGKRKKVRKPREESNGPNPFQEAADVRARPRKRLRSDQARWGNQPRRI